MSLSKLLYLFLSKPCPCCGVQLGSQIGLCIKCEDNLQPSLDYVPFNPSNLGLISLGTYKGGLRRAVKAFKYSGARDISKPLGKTLASGIPTIWNIKTIIPVPMHTNRKHKRGYNQAELLANEIANKLGIPVYNSLTRTRNTKQQALLSAEERKHNLGNAFALSGKLPVGNILLVDDVLTTGATLQACTNILQVSCTGNIYYAVAAR